MIEQGAAAHPAHAFAGHASISLNLAHNLLSGGALIAANARHVEHQVGGREHEARPRKIPAMRAAQSLEARFPGG